jgi:uncharacterized integral membrane protein (TIGR00698 family)
MNIRGHIAGFSFVFGVAGLSFYLSTVYPSFDAQAVSLVIGMLAGNLIVHEDLFKKGGEAALKVFLPLGIALYGLQMGFNEFSWGLLPSVLPVVCGLFGLTMLLAVIFNIKKRVGLLVASGLSICGPSAVAVMSPLIGASKEETSVSALSVTMLGLAGMILYPVINDLLALTHEEFSFLAGATLPMLGQVKSASAGVCPECFSSAQKVKLIRTSFLLLPVAMAIFRSVREEKKVKVPSFVIAFLGLAVGANLIRGFGPALEVLKSAGGLCLAAAYASIGLLVDFDSVVEEGIGPLAVILFASVVVILMIYLFGNLF